MKKAIVRTLPDVLLINPYTQNMSPVGEEFEVSESLAQVWKERKLVEIVRILTPLSRSKDSPMMEVPAYPVIETPFEDKPTEFKKKRSRKTLIRKKGKKKKAGAD